jgi:hypothetical protein
MKKIISISSLLILAFCISCNSPQASESKKSDDVLKDTSIVIEKNTDTLSDLKDTLIHNETSEILSIENWKIEDFITTKKYKNSESVRRIIESRLDQWKNVKNPFVATYKGCDFGDYFHLNFVDANGISFDFGFAENNFGEYILYSGEQYVDNPKYLGKKFKVYWNWKIAGFPCCDGEYDLVEAYLPTIVKLELVEEKK